MGSVLAPPLATWVTPDKPHDQSSYCPQSICYGPGSGTISQFSQLSNGDEVPAACGSDGQMLRWVQHPGQGQPRPLGSHPRMLPALATPLAWRHSLMLQELGRTGPLLPLPHTMGKSAGALGRRGQAIPDRPWHRPRLAYFPH